MRILESSCYRLGLAGSGAVGVRCRREAQRPSESGSLQTDPESSHARSLAVQGARKQSSQLSVNTYLPNPKPLLSFPESSCLITHQRLSRFLPQRNCPETTQTKINQIVLVSLSAPKKTAKTRARVRQTGLEITKTGIKPTSSGHPSNTMADRPKEIRILGLHGMGTSAHIFKTQTGPYRGSETIIHSTFRQ